MRILASMQISLQKSLNVTTIQVERSEGFVPAPPPYYHLYLHCGQHVSWFICHRFYYERQGQFSPDQLVQLNQASLSRILCDNAEDIHRVPIDAFILQDSSDFVSCSNLPSVDLTMWQECCEWGGEAIVKLRKSAEADWIS